jgi:phage baseplate assembly protein V
MRALINGMVNLAVITRVYDTKRTQRAQATVRPGEIVEAPHLQPFGLSFTPPEGAQAVALALAGRRANTIIICADHPGKRPTGAPAECGGLYQKGAWVVYVDDAGVVHIGAETGASAIARADKVDDELAAIKATLASLTGEASFGVPYEPAVDGVGATKGKVT